MISAPALSSSRRAFSVVSRSGSPAMMKGMKAHLRRTPFESRLRFSIHLKQEGKMPSWKALHGKQLHICFEWCLSPGSLQCFQLGVICNKGPISASIGRVHHIQSQRHSITLNVFIACLDWTLDDRIGVYILAQVLRPMLAQDKAGRKERHDMNSPITSGLSLQILQADWLHLTDSTATPRPMKTSS